MGNGFITYQPYTLKKSNSNWDHLNCSLCMVQLSTFLKSNWDTVIIPNIINVNILTINIIRSNMINGFHDFGYSGSTVPD